VYRHRETEKKKRSPKRMKREGKDARLPKRGAIEKGRTLERKNSLFESGKTTGGESPPRGTGKEANGQMLTIIMQQQGEKVGMGRQKGDALDRGRELMPTRLSCP